MPKCILTLLLLCVVWPNLKAQQNNIFTAYTVNDGLPQSSIDEIIQDKNGFLWIGTAGGLSRFDGYNFKTYKHQKKTTTAINSDRGFHFYNDSIGQLWMVSYNGISLYHADKDQFTNLITYEPYKTVTSENCIFGETKEFIWAGLNNYGIIKVNKKTFKTEKIAIPGLTMHTNHVAWYRGFIEKDNIWIITNNDFIIYNINTKTSRKIKIKLERICNINSTTAVGYSSNKIITLNKKTFQYNTVNLSTKDTATIFANIYKLSDTSAVFCSSNKGLFVLNILTGNIIERIEQFNQNRNTTPDANCAYKDASGNLWIGTLNDGLRKLQFPFKRFKLYQSGNSSTNMINSIYADSQKVYIGNSGNGIDIYARNKGFEKNIAPAKTITGISNTSPVANAVSPNQLIVIGYSSTPKKPTTLLNFFPDKNVIKPFNKSILDTIRARWGDGNLRNFVYKISSNYYLTNAGEYLIAIELNKVNQFYAHTLQQFPGDMLTTCFKDKKGNLIIGTYKNLQVYKNGVWQKVSLPNKLEMKTITQDPDENIWVGTSNGIYVLDNNYQLIKTYDEENLLLNEHLYGMLSDNKGDIWFSHNKGISVYRWNTKKFKHYRKEDGLQSDEFNASAYFKAADGELFFGGINGTSSFYPEDIKVNPFSPKVKITNIRLFDIPLKTEQSYWEIATISLPYTDNSLSFDFTLPEFTNPSKNQYAYMMEGVDKTWIQAGDRRFARYPALSPGNYTFKVKAANNDGVWGKQPTTIAIEIIPPFWQRSWFILLSITAAVGLVFSVTVYWQKRQHQKVVRALEVQHKLQLERERISRDLHDNVGTHMSLLSKSLESIIEPGEDGLDAEKVNQLSILSASSKEVISNLRESIWALHKEKITIEEFADKLKVYAQKQIKLVPTIKLIIKEDIQEIGTILNSSQAIHLFRICQEAITNSMKYASPTTLSIAIFANKEYYEILIEDNGIGFDKKLKDGDPHYGLQNMEFRATEINCSFTIESALGKGTRIRIKGK